MRKSFWTAALAALVLAAPALAGHAKDGQTSPAQALIAEGDKLAEDGRHEEALAKYHAAAGLEPSNHEAHYSIASVHMAMKQPVEAISAYRAANRADPADEGTLRGLAGAALQAKDPAEARRAADLLLKLDPGSGDAHRIRGDASAAQGQDRQAYDHYKAALAADPAVRRGKSSLAAAALKLGRRDEALAILRDLAEISPRGFAMLSKDPRLASLKDDPTFLSIRPGAVEPDAAREGRPAPKFELALLDGSGNASPEAYRGRLLLVNFWATW